MSKELDLQNSQDKSDNFNPLVLNENEEKIGKWKKTWEGLIIGVWFLLLALYILFFWIDILIEYFFGSTTREN